MVRIGFSIVVFATDYYCLARLYDIIAVGHGNVQFFPTSSFFLTLAPSASSTLARLMYVFVHSFLSFV